MEGLRYLPFRCAFAHMGRAASFTPGTLGSPSRDAGQPLAGGEAARAVAKDRS